MSFQTTLSLFAVLAIVYLSQAHPIRSDQSKPAEITDVATTSEPNVEKEIKPVETTAVVDTLNETSSGRVKRQGGCGCCGCGCCCCRPRCCCCCRRCCTCCRTCCCTRCCTCCRPCCCCGCGGGCGGGCGCCGCGGCGCGCCGCGGGRKRRSLQALKIKLADSIERAARLALGTTVEQTKPKEEGNSETEIIDEQLRKMEKQGETTTEWPQPVYELVTETYSQ